MRALLLNLVLLACCSAAAQHKALDAFEQNRRLGHGVNIIGYDPLWQNRDQARFKERYFRLLKEAGFTSVRINLYAFRHMDPTKDNALGNRWWETLAWAVDGATAQGLLAIVDLHEFVAMADDPVGNKASFIGFWRQVATRYKDAPSTVLFEILNEPNKKLTPELWNDYLAEALSIIRESNPTRTVIIGPAFWNSIDHLKELRLPEADRNIIVTVHYYQPMEFTHQGARWTAYKDKTGVEWKGTEEEREKIENDFHKATAWAKEHNRPIFLGEFGAYDKAPMESRARYVAAVARAAEAESWSWAYWQFDKDFVLYDIPHEQWVEPILRALAPVK